MHLVADKYEFHLCNPTDLIVVERPGDSRAIETKCSKFEFDRDWSTAKRSEYFKPPLLEDEEHTPICARLSTESRRSIVATHLEAWNWGQKLRRDGFVNMGKMMFQYLY